MNDIIPFGKYQGQPIEVLAQDQSYIDWLMSQDWFKDRFPGIYTIIINNFREPSETPDHNTLQALFLNQKFTANVIEKAYPGYVGEHVGVKGISELTITFEIVSDVLVDFSFFGFVVGIEIKPSIGDDYPAIIRQIRAAEKTHYHRHSSFFKAILFAEKFTAVGVSKYQLVEIMRLSHISVVFLDEISL